MQLNELTQEILTALSPAQSQESGTLLVCMISGLPLKVLDFTLSGRPLKLSKHPIFHPENHKEWQRLLALPSCPPAFLAASCLALAHLSGRLIPTNDPLEVRRLNRALQALGQQELRKLITAFQKDLRPNLRPQSNAKELASNLDLIGYQFKLMSGLIVLSVEGGTNDISLEMPVRAYQMSVKHRLKKEDKKDIPSILSRLPKTIYTFAKEQKELLGFKNMAALKAYFDTLTIYKMLSKEALQALQDYLLSIKDIISDFKAEEDLQLMADELGVWIERAQTRQEQNLPELEDDFLF